MEDNLSRVKIVTDSTAQLDPDLVQELGITVVPLEISFGSQQFFEGVDLTTEEFFRRVARSHVMPGACLRLDQAISQPAA